MDLLKALMILFLGTGAWGKNIVMVLVDDLDLTLDGMQPLQNTQTFIGGQGATYENCFVASPICCPNRASILTGRYQHNHNTVNNSIFGGCSSRSWQRNSEENTFATILKGKIGYTTFYAGKYLNEYGSRGAGGPQYIPPGWDWWYGLVGNSKYFDYSLSINGTERKYGHTPDQYLTDVIKQAALTFLNTRSTNSGPFLMVLAPPAPHEPWTPAARHNDRYKRQKAKRTLNFNTQAQSDKHWLVRMGPSPLPNSVLLTLDDIYRRRWETLLAVDDLVMTVYTALKNSHLLDDTYMIFTSDNGYHIGQFSMPMDKRQPYESDIRVPLLIRGPGITPGSQVKAPVSSVDLFSTILEMGGTEAVSDGTSMLSKNISDDRSVLIEYRGEHSIGSPNSGCPSDDDFNLSHCNKNLGCKCQDVTNNTYACVRRFSEKHNNIFCIFEDDTKYIEAYDLNADPFQMSNIGYSMNKGRRYRFRKRLKELVKCEGADCVRAQPMSSH
ncbi:N-acetylglucosamine-6-sulfatase [Diachasma alloeum]|uniref:N-acetylglucosamine-6-sulfatase n=1 Tax=Diachasma alloeum TaxID=454923 RepID=UPI00073815A5|nr:N-acetylglucosamine-6-sulfatase [Diachasma alloeum]